MLDNLAEYAPDTPPDRLAAFGYFQAMAITQVLEEAVDQGDLSRDGIRQAVESLDSVDAGPMGTYTYGPAADREPPRTVSIFQVNPDLPTGLEVVAQDYESDATEEYEIP
jgi:Periplasmic binding protein